MAEVFDPALLLAGAWLVALFAVGWRYRWGSLPPARTLLLVAVALFWLAFSLTQVAVFVTRPDEDLVVAAASLLSFVGATACWRWCRTR